MHAKQLCALDLGQTQVDETVSVVYVIELIHFIQLSHSNGRTKVR